MKLQTFVQAYLGHCFYGCFTKQQKKFFFLKEKKNCYFNSTLAWYDQSRQWPLVS